MKYLKNSKGYVLTFQCSNHLEVVGYLDSNLAECQYDLKLTPCYIFMPVESAISWKSAN